VADYLARKLGGHPGIRFLTPRQLVPELAMDLAEAGTVMFIDATVEPLPEGYRWDALAVETVTISPYAHLFRAGYILGLTASVYGQRPSAYMISIQGEDFSHGVGLSTPARIRARRAAETIRRFLSAAIGGGTWAPNPIS
jgi:Ni,Fe-hydrogenase maturation factor